MECTRDLEKEFCGLSLNNSESINDPSEKESSAKSPRDSSEVPSEANKQSPSKTPSKRNRGTEEAKNSVKGSLDNESIISSSECLKRLRSGDTPSNSDSKSKSNSNKQESAIHSCESQDRFNEDYSKRSISSETSKTLALQSQQKLTRSVKGKVDFLFDVSLHPGENIGGSHISANSKLHNDQENTGSLVPRERQKVFEYDEDNLAEIPYTIVSNDEDQQESFSFQDDYIICDGKVASECFETSNLLETDPSNRSIVKIRISKIKDITLNYHFKHDIRAWKYIFGKLKGENIKGLTITNPDAGIDEVLSLVEFTIKKLRIKWKKSHPTSDWMHHLRHLSGRMKRIFFFNCHFQQVHIQSLFALIDTAEKVGFDKCTFYCDDTAENELHSPEEFFQREMKKLRTIRLNGCKFHVINLADSTQTKRVYTKVAEKNMWPVVFNLFRPFIDTIDQLSSEGDSISHPLSSRPSVIIKIWDGLKMVSIISCLKWILKLNLHPGCFDWMYCENMPADEDERDQIRQELRDIGIQDLQLMNQIIDQLGSDGHFRIAKLLSRVLGVLKRHTEQYENVAKSTLDLIPQLERLQGILKKNE